MAETLKSRYGIEVVAGIAATIKQVDQRFDSVAFLAEVEPGYERLELMDRGRSVACALRKHLPGEYLEALRILVASSDIEPPWRDSSLASFFYLPHLTFVGAYGIEFLEESMAAFHRLTSKFTAEFAIRPFLERYPDQVLVILRLWARDADPEVRRLVSEGTRPRLPWAARLRQFQDDPRPALALLEILKDDSSLYVRRSVANHLNDIGKDHPEVLVDTVKRWSADTSEDRRWIIRRALRSEIKRGNPAALAVLGYEAEAKLKVTNGKVSPATVWGGGEVEISFEIVSETNRWQKIVADFQIFFVKSGGAPRAKVFKLRNLDLGPREKLFLKKRVSLKPLTTRRHYPGLHRVEALLNGKVFPVGQFDFRGEEGATEDSSSQSD